MILHTASEGISFSKKLENDSAEFYKNLAQQNAADAETLLSFAGENKKNIVQVERAYYGVITDAIEGCFAFNIDPDDYSLKTAVKEGTDYADALKQAVEMENLIIKFYTDAAEQSRSLMADVPRAFTLVARKRAGRLEKLDALLNR
jgi:rubrerythrin